MSSQRADDAQSVRNKSPRPGKIFKGLWIQKLLNKNVKFYSEVDKNGVLKPFVNVLVLLLRKRSFNVQLQRC